MFITDTHIHLYAEEFDYDREVLVKRAQQAGVNRFFLPAIDSSYISRMREVQSQWPENVFLMCGLHPTYVKENWESELQIVETELKTGNYIAVGEIGIDLYWDKTWIEEQIVAFRRQIEWSIQYNLPIAIHCREAFDEIFEQLEDYRGKGLRGIFHCFTGTLEQANQAIDLGLHIGIGGVLTFKNGIIDTFLNQIPLEKIVLETDAPYLAPVPYRGKRNEPAYLVLVLRRLAEIYGKSEAEVAQITTQNANQIFRCS